LNIFKICGPDGLHTEIMHKALFVLAKALKLNFYVSLHTNALTSDWSAADVSAINKKEANEKLVIIGPLA
jgi:hypothetical protein